MTRDNPLLKKLFELTEPVVADHGYELVDIEFRREQTGWIMRVFIDQPSGISFADCERVSRELSAVLDVADVIAQTYRLEVSSPGVDRPLRTAAHFRSQIGSIARIVLGQGIDGRRNFKGQVVAVEPDTVVVDVDGTTYKLPVGDIDSAKLVPDWDSVLRERDQ
jgi:ribosome maturation factor RimP